ENFWAHLGNMIVDYDMIAEATSRKLLDEPLFDSANEFAYYGFDTMIEQTPNPSSRVVLSDDRDSFGVRRVKLDWRISDSDVQNLWRCYEVIGAELGQIGAGRVRLLRDQKQLVWGKYLSWGSHHMGTTRMH